jgi:hypothetical protein
MQPKNVVAARAAAAASQPNPAWLESTTSDAGVMTPSQLTHAKQVLLNTVAAALLKSPRFDVGLNDPTSVVSRILHSYRHLTNLITITWHSLPL